MLAEQNLAVADLECLTRDQSSFHSLHHFWKEQMTTDPFPSADESKHVYPKNLFEL